MRCLLVRIPGNPFNISDLRPDTRLASLAGALVATGHRPAIVDFGTLDMLERLHPSELTGPYEAAARDLPADNLIDEDPYSRGFLSKRGSMRRVVEYLHGVWDQVGEELAARRDFDFVLFKINSIKDLAPTYRAAGRMRAMAPHSVLLATGPVFSQGHDLVSSALRYMDGVYLGPANPSVGCLAECIQDRHKWKDVPLLAYKDGVRFNLTGGDVDGLDATLSRPIFEPGVYEGLGNRTKLLLFDMDEVHAADNPAMRPVVGGQIRCKPAPELLGEIAAIHARFGSRAFHIAGSVPASGHLNAVAYELLSQKMRIRYSRDADISSVTPATVGALTASGCAAVGFRIDSGSQRLLDTYYHRRFGVSQVERVVRACKFSNLFTITQYTYPSAEDDHHTLAETLRLIERTQPDSVNIEMQGAQPDPNVPRLLLHEFRPFARYHKRRAAQRHAQLRNELRESGMTMDLTARFALLADLTGHKGRERDLAKRLKRLLLAGNAEGLREIIGNANRAARRPSDAFAFMPFTSPEDAVAN